VRKWTKPDNHDLIGGAVADATRSKAELMLENALLRQQLIVVFRQVKRSQMSWRERGIMVLLASKLRNWKAAVFIVQPDTLLRWHRDIFRLVWRRKSQAKQRADDYRCRGGWCSLCGVWRARPRCGERSVFGGNYSSSTSGWPRAAFRSIRKISEG
jgi:hypothetical protein